MELVDQPRIWRFFNLAGFAQDNADFAINHCDYRYFSLSIPEAGKRLSFFWEASLFFGFSIPGF
jgi:hypothetical protein